MGCGEGECCGRLVADVSGGGENQKLMEKMGDCKCLHVDAPKEERGSFNLTYRMSRILTV